MTGELRAHLVPSLFDPAELHGGVAVVIDLLRASSTIVHALGAGALRVLPCLEVDDARAYAAGHPDEPLALGGERGGELIEGFDLDNSPLSYTPERVAGKTVVFTTTNGTRALLRSSEAERVYVGAFANLSALLSLLADEPRPVHLVCAGTRGQVSADDCLCAGAISAGLAAARGRSGWEDDSARLVTEFFLANSQDEGALLGALRSSVGGRDLLELGFDADIVRCGTWDLFPIVPEFFARDAEIRGAAV